MTPASGNRASRRRQAAEQKAAQRRMRRAGRIMPAPHPNVRRASEADRKWFAAHPWRSHYIRPALPSELPGIPGGRDDIWVVVRQVRPGMRLGAVLTWAMPEPPPDYEALAHALFDTLSEHAAAGSPWGTRLNLSKLFERAMRMASGGRA